MHIKLCSSGRDDMTHDELMALPENGGFQKRVVKRGDPDWPKDMEIVGDTIGIPYARPGKVMAMVAKDEPFVVTDSNGLSWSLGYIDGVLHRSRSSLSDVVVWSDKETP